MITMIIVIVAAFGLGFAVGIYIATKVQYRKCLEMYKQDLAFTVKKNKELREQLMERQLRKANDN